MFTSAPSSIPLPGRWVASIVLAGMLALGSASPAVADPPPPANEGCSIGDKLRLPELPATPPRLGARPKYGETPRPHWRKNLFVRVATDQKFLFTTWVPMELRRPEFIYPLAGATLAAIGSNRDRPGPELRISQYVENLGSGSAEASLQAATTLGEGASAAVLLGGTYFVSRWTGHTRMARASSLSAEALLNTAIWSTVLKRVTRRARPSSETEAGNFFAGSSSENTSYPSGHAMGAFAVASVFAGEFRDKKWVGWVAYGSAAIVAASRVGLGRHYLSDVIVGGMLGSSLGRMVVAREHGVTGRDVLGRFQPVVDPVTETYGLMYRHSW